eukprot:Hpha_TRINITY_DN9627_c0_g1::TRINITY_DN9627_c0_g1_i1::g.184453::m.184453
MSLGRPIPPCWAPPSPPPAPSPRVDLLSDVSEPAVPHLSPHHRVSPHRGSELSWRSGAGVPIILSGTPLGPSPIGSPQRLLESPRVPSSSRGEREPLAASVSYNGEGVPSTYLVGAPFEAALPADLRPAPYLAGGPFEAALPPSDTTRVSYLAGGPFEAALPADLRPAPYLAGGPFEAALPPSDTTRVSYLADTPAVAPSEPTPIPPLPRTAPSLSGAARLHQLAGGAPVRTPPSPNAHYTPISGSVSGVGGYFAPPMPPPPEGLPRAVPPMGLGGNWMELRAPPCYYPPEWGARVDNLRQRFGIQEAEAVRALRRYRGHAGRAANEYLRSQR